MRFTEKSFGLPSSSTAYRTNEDCSNANPGKAGSTTSEASAGAEVGTSIERELPCLGTAAVSPCEASPRTMWAMFTEMGAIVTLDELPRPTARNQGICIRRMTSLMEEGEGGSRVIYRLTHGELFGDCLGL